MLCNETGHQLRFTKALIVPGMISQILQYDMWDKTPTDLWDWAALKEKIAKLVTTCMIHNFNKSVEDLEIKFTWECFNT